jgi:hypothetical protein
MFTFIGETALAVALGAAVCKPRGSGKTEMLTATRSFAITGYATNMLMQESAIDDFIATDFTSVREVRDVRVSHNGNLFKAEITVSSFDRSVRRKVYAKQRGFYREFPSLSFEFYLIDGSMDSPENAIA